MLPCPESPHHLQGAPLLPPSPLRPPPSLAFWEGAMVPAVPGSGQAPGLPGLTAEPLADHYSPGGWPGRTHLAVLRDHPRQPVTWTLGPGANR